MPTIKDLRYIRCITQRQLAESIGVSMNLVWMWENGLRSPGPRTRALLYDYFGTNDITLKWPKGKKYE